MNRNDFIIPANIISCHSLGVYDARMRVLILYIANLLRVPVQLVELFEESIVEMLSSELPPETEEDVREKARRQRIKKIKRYCMIGLAGKVYQMKAHGNYF